MVAKEGEQLLRYVAFSVGVDMIIEVAFDSLSDVLLSERVCQSSQEQLHLFGPLRAARCDDLRQVHAVAENRNLGAESGNVCVYRKLFDGLSPDRRHVRPPLAFSPVLVPSRCDSFRPSMIACMLLRRVGWLTGAAKSTSHCCL